MATHNEARKTQLDDTFAATKALYADYLTLFLPEFSASDKHPPKKI